MTHTQVYRLYVEPARGEHGEVTFPPVTIGTPMSGEDLFRYRAFLNRVTDPAVVDRLWAEEQERQAAEPKKGGRR